MARNLEDSIQDINRVEVKDLKNYFSMQDWKKDLNEVNSDLNKLLNSSFFKRQEKFVNAHYIDMKIFNLFGILHCKGDFLMKV